MIEELYSTLTSNPYFSAGFGLVGVGALLSGLRKGSLVSLQIARRQLLVTLELNSKDKSYAWLLNHISNIKTIKSQQLSVNTLFKQHDNGTVTTNFNLVPGPGKHFFKYQSAWFQVERARENKMMDLATGLPFETLTLTTLSRDRNLLHGLLSEARQSALRDQTGKTVIYTSYGPEWRPFGSPRKPKLLASVVLKENQSERIVEDVKEFLRNGEWYHRRGIPYRRGYLLYGPPGSGKSSFIQALAGDLGYNICILNLSERGLTDDRLNHLLTLVPERSILLLEDIDAAFTKRIQTDQQGFQSMVTFSGLLNALDGVAAAEERIIFMTTNHLSQLDPALIRPGRVDRKELLDDVDPYQIKNLFLRFYEGQETLANQFVEKLKGYKVSAASLQGHFVYFKDDPKLALENWKPSDKDDAKI